MTRPGPTTFNPVELTHLQLTVVRALAAGRPDASPNPAGYLGQRRTEWLLGLAEILDAGIQQLRADETYTPLITLMLQAAPDRTERFLPVEYLTRISEQLQETLRAPDGGHWAADLFIVAFEQVLKQIDDRTPSG